MPSAQDVYDQSVRSLPSRCGSGLAALILEDLARADVRIVDADDAWSEQDEQDLTAFSLRYTAGQFTRRSKRLPSAGE